MKQMLLGLMLPLAGVAGLQAATQPTMQDYTQYVNPFVGTGGHGHVFLGANVPFGHIQAGPTQKKQGWDWCSGYHYSDSVLVGFGQMHLSGTGIGDLGDIALLPVTKNNEREVKFSHKAEYATPGYYAVTLANGVRVELTATPRTAFHRYTLSVLSFEPTGQPLMVKVGISSVSIENARKNLHQESPNWNFNTVVADAQTAWNKELGKIDIQTNNATDKRIFYTSLYHTMTAPSVFNDVNGEYRGADGKTYRGDFTPYTTFSLWDTYRAAHPLMTLIHPEKQRDIAQTMLHIAQQQGRLPVWYLEGNETDCMVGNPGIPVLVDIALKGFDVDKHAVLDAAKKTQLFGDRGLDLLKKYGYLPCDLDPTHETVAKGLEYALADGCIARLAKALKAEKDYKYFLKRSQSYRDYYFDKQTKFMRGIDSKGHFREPFDPFKTIHRADDYTEGTAWQYIWLVPHDVHGLISIFGGDKPFTNKLDSLFVVQGDMGEDASPDISGLIGQYAHGNEPSHHIVYLYDYAGQPWKTASRVREVLNTMYHDNVDGLSGNEDVGQMSAWYILSSLGFYQVEPAGGRYVFGSPLFDEATMNVGKGKTFRIIAHNNSKENMYIQSVKLNGKPYTRSYIDFKDIVRGGKLEFMMGSKPSKFGVKPADRP